MCFYVKANNALVRLTMYFPSHTKDILMTLSIYESFPFDAQKGSEYVFMVLYDKFLGHFR